MEKRERKIGKQKTVKKIDCNNTIEKEEIEDNKSGRIKKDQRRNTATKGNLAAEQISGMRTNVNLKKNNMKRNAAM